METEPSTITLTPVKRSCPVSITDLAMAEIRTILTVKHIPVGYYLRLGAKSVSGCGGTNYILGFDKPAPQDDVYQVGDLMVLIEKKHTMFLIGLQLDFVNNEKERGFVFGPKA